MSIPRTIDRPAPVKGKGTNVEKPLSLSSRNKSKEKPVQEESSTGSIPTGHPFWIQDGIGEHSQYFAATRA